MKDRARRFTLDLARRFSSNRQTQCFDEALKSVAIVAYKAVEVHCAYILARNFLLAIPEFVKDPACAKAVTRLLELLLLQLLREQAGDWIGSGLGAEEMEHALDRIHVLLDELRPDVVGLSDALGHNDKALKNSTLGRYDGNVYEAIYNRAQLSPLNGDGKPMVAWEHMSKVLDLDFLREGMRLQRVDAKDAPVCSKL